MLMAAPLLDLATMPVWALWVFALTGLACVGGVAVWSLAPRLRQPHVAVILLGAALFCARAATARDPRAVLWMGGLLGIGIGLALLLMGRMPADMPSAQDPAVRKHPLYPVVVRRARIAGIGMVIAVVTLSVLSVLFVRGVWHG
jgi:hypothetical protein